MRIVFMGTPDFAAIILKSLVVNKYNVVGVVTVADKPAGRGQKMNESPVKIYAASQNIPILQPDKLKDEIFLNALSALNADLFVVVAFRMLPEVVWSMPTKGTINLHGSLLPQYRGAAPINWAIINGESKTGVTSFIIEKEIDTGKILLQKEIDIEPNETAGDIHDKLAKLGADVILVTVDRLTEGNLQAIDQQTFDLSNLKKAPKIFKEDGEINWNQGVHTIHNFIRGLSPYPGAWCHLNKNGKNVLFKLSNTQLTDISSLGKTIEVINDGILFPTKDFYLKVMEIQMEGKRKMTFKEFQAGNDIESFTMP